MSFFSKALAGQTIDSVWTDTEVTYMMLANGTQITIRGVVLVQPKPLDQSSNVETSRPLS